MILENTEIAYQSKTTKELKKGLFIFKLFRFPWIMEIGGKLTILFLKWGWPLPSIVKSLIYKQFCGGENESEAQKVIQDLATYNVNSCVHHAAEDIPTEAGRTAVLDRFIDILQLSKQNKSFTFSVIKPTGLGAPALFEKVSAGMVLTPEESKQWKLLQERFQFCCDQAFQFNTKLLVDAEESWYQNGIDQFLEPLMLNYNKKRAHVFTTLQMYRVDRMEYLEKLLPWAKNNKIIFGIKLVRGAYLSKEKEYALSKGIPSVICPTKEATDANFETALQFILTHIAHFALFLGSHNEQNVLQTMIFMKKHHIEPNHPHIYFSQLYGMSDHLTFNLAHHGFQALKYIPYGTVEEAIPYLLRRVKENTAVMSQSKRELDLYQKELQRRYSTAAL